MTSKLQCCTLVYRLCDFQTTVFPIGLQVMRLPLYGASAGLYVKWCPPYSPSCWSIGHATSIAQCFTLVYRSRDFPNTVLPIGLDRSCDYDSASHWSIGHVTITVLPIGPCDFMGFPSYSACYWSTGHVTSPVQCFILVYGPCDFLITVVHRMSCDLILQYSASRWSI